jgi:hypothetical protein
MIFLCVNPEKDGLNTWRLVWIGEAATMLPLIELWHYPVTKWLLGIIVFLGVVIFVGDILDKIEKDNEGEL